MRWNNHHFLRFGIIALFLVITSIVFNISADFYIQKHLNTLADHSNAGQYLTFVIGIPLTLLAAAIGAFISYQIGQFTKSKDDFSILDFVDKISSPVVAALGSCATAVEEFSRIGSDMKAAVEAAFRKASSDSSLKTRIEMVAAVKAILAETQKENLDNVGHILTTLSSRFSDLPRHMRSALFLKQRAKRISSLLPINRLRETLPFDLTDKMATTSLRDIPGHLRWCHSHTFGADLYRAYVLLPDSFSAIEFLGMALFGPYRELANTVTLRDGKEITGYTINVGAAYIATLYACLPEKEDMLKAFQDLVTVPRAARRYLELAGPDMSELAMPKIVEAMTTILDNPNRLIVLETADDAVFYDPAEHGDIRQWPLKQEGSQ